MDINLEDETYCTIQYLEASLKYVENEYSAKHGCVPVNELEPVPCSNLLSSATASGSSQ